MAGDTNFIFECWKYFSRVRDAFSTRISIELLTLESLWFSGRASEHGSPKVWGSIPHGDSEVFRCPTLVKRQKTYLSISLPSLKLTIFLILFTKNGISNIADPSSTQDACHMKFVIDLARHSLCGSVVEYRSAEVRRFEVRFLMEFFLSPTLVTRRKTSFSTKQLLLVVELILNPLNL